MALVDTVPSSSSDVLFPEPQSGYAPHEDSFYGSTASTYSSYSREVNYIFEPQYSKPRADYPDISHFESVREEEEDGPARPEPIQNIYTPPRRTTHNHNTRRLPPSILSLPTKFDIHPSRRRTWSPPTCSKSMGSATSFHAMRSYRSNDALDMDMSGENLYEELDSATGQTSAGERGGGPPAPPKLAPVSGILQKVILLFHVSYTLIKALNLLVFFSKSISDFRFVKDK